jgi:hypothetical protein
MYHLMHPEWRYQAVKVLNRAEGLDSIYEPHCCVDKYSFDLRCSETTHSQTEVKPSILSGPHPLMIVYSFKYKEIKKIAEIELI